MRKSHTFSRCYAHYHAVMKWIAGKEVCKLRQRTGLSQAEFARVYHIPAATIRRWEQGTDNPSGPAMTLLNIIDRDPAIVRRLLEDIE